MCNQMKPAKFLFSLSSPFHTMSNIANTVVSSAWHAMPIINCLREKQVGSSLIGIVLSAASFLQSCWHGLRDQYRVAEGRRLAHHTIGRLWASIKDGAQSAFPHSFRYYYKEKCRSFCSQIWLNLLVPIDYIKITGLATPHNWGQKKHIPTSK
jgi:hypothetical protein